MTPFNHPFKGLLHASGTEAEIERHAISPMEGRQPKDKNVPSKKKHSGFAENASLPPGLHVVATPIGNMGDITLRAVETLARASVVACEDTRVTGLLLKRLGLSTPMIPYHDHNAARVRPLLLARLQAGETVALVSDAGTPLISDPGFKLTRMAREAGIAVTAAPGASAVLAALMSAGLPTDRFLFAGFPPSRDKARRAFFQTFRSVPATLVFYESVRRLSASLGAMAEVFGQREAALCRELTKRFEEVRCDSLTGLAEHYASCDPPKGEAVIVVGPPGALAEEDAADAGEAGGILQAALTRGSLKDAVNETVAATGLPRRVVYAQALALVEAGKKP